MTTSINPEKSNVEKSEPKYVNWNQVKKTCLGFACVAATTIGLYAMAYYAGMQGANKVLTDFADAAFDEEFEHHKAEIDRKMKELQD